MNNVRVEELLEMLFVLDEEVKENIQKNFDELPAQKQKKIVYVLEKSLEKQNEFLEKALKNNPDLMTDIKMGVAQEMRKIRKNEEEKNEKDELQILKSLESQLSNL